MPSGTLSLGKSKQTEGQLLWTATANGTEANTSTVTVTLQVRRWDGNYTTTGTWSGKVTIGGTAESFSFYAAVNNSWTTVKTLTVTVNHNSDGSGSCYIYGSVNGPTETTQEGATVSGSITVTLDKITRYASIISATDFTDEGNPTITYSNPAGTSVSSLQACISLDGSTEKTTYKDVPKTGTSYSLPLTDTEKNALRAATPNSNTLNVYVLLKTVIGSGSDVKSVSAQMTIANANPTISPTVVDTNSATTALTGNSAILVALHSVASVTINATAQKYATIKSKKVEHGTVTLTADGTLNVTNNPIKFTAVDSRGNTTTQNATNTIVPYINPTCAIGNNIPETDGSFALVVTGLFYNGSIGATTNSLTVQYRYKAAGGSYSGWINIGTITKSGNSYTATANLTGLDYQTVYTFQARAIDKLNASGVSSAEKAVIAEPVFDWGKSDFRFNVPVNLGSGVDIFRDGAVAYAPAGYGLGAAVPYITWAEADTTYLPGWYRFSDSIVIGSITFNYGYMRVDAFGTSACIQTLYIVANPSIILCRNRSSSAWQEWEWINPPMNAGVEYRTTERYQGKPVYAKVINFGALPNNSYKSISHGLTKTAVVSLSAASTDGKYHFPGTSNSETVELYINASYIIMTVTGDWSSVNAYVTVKYTKD